MKKMLLKLVGLSIIGLTLAGCEANPNTSGGAVIKLPTQEKNWTRQPLENAKFLRRGMTEAEVIQIMGEPVTREFQDRRSALQGVQQEQSEQITHTIDFYLLHLLMKD